jgi:hypothetical protein
VDPNNISESEKNLIAEIAKQKNKSFEEVLEELGHTVAPPSDEVVTLEGAPSDVQDTEQAEPAPAQRFDIPVVPEEPLPPPPADTQPDVTTEEEEETEAPLSTLNIVCPQCGWDHANPTVSEPENKDKLAFLHVILGAKVFSKQYSLFDGKLKAEFRTLTVKELDLLYAEAFNAQKAGLITNTSDYYEYLNRLRVCLQLIKLSASSHSLHVVLPTGLTEESHPDTDSYWDSFLKSKGIDYEPERLVLAVQDYVLEQVLKTEHLHRLITHESAKFNRLVSKLEACVDNPDFWKETEQPH